MSDDDLLKGAFGYGEKLGARCAALEAENARLNTENAALKDTVQILNNRVRFRDGEIQKLRAVLPSISRVNYLAGVCVGNGLTKTGRELRDMASVVEAALKGREG